MIVIALDAMGGDFAPRVPVEAAVRATRRLGCHVVLVGDRERLEPELRRHSHDPARLSIHHTSQVIGMEDSPTAALRERSDASLRQAFELVRRGEAQAVVGAGQTGAMMVVGKYVLDTLPGIDRPAIATPLPLKHGTSLLLDSGANVDCKPQYLLQFARMGAEYARAVLGVADPRVGLLNIGTEPGKGNELTRQAYALLQESGPGFVGNVEGRDLFRGRAEVLVCDGFVGNLVLKTAEAASRQVRLLLKESIARSPLARVGYWLMRGFFLELARRTDYREVGGSLLLGLREVTVVCHGGSNARAVAGGIALAVDCVAQDLVGAIGRAFHGDGPHSALA